MAQLDMGLTAAIIAAIIFGSYFTPIKFSRLTSNQYAMITLVFAALSSVVVLLFIRESFKINLSDFSFPLISGALFAVGLILAFFSIREIGIAKAGAIYIGLQLVVSAVIGILFFNELLPLSSFQRIETIIGIMMVVVGIVFISIAKL